MPRLESVWLGSAIRYTSSSEWGKKKSLLITHAQDGIMPSCWENSEGGSGGSKPTYLKVTFTSASEGLNSLMDSGESLLQKWCKDSIEYACVLGMPLTAEEEQKILAKASEIAHDKQYRYPVEGLFGTLWAMVTRTLHKRNIFDMKYAIQCATYVRMCYQAIEKDPLC